MSASVVAGAEQHETWTRDQRFHRFVLTGRAFGMAHATQRPGLSAELALGVERDPEWALAELHKVRSVSPHFNREAFFTVLARLASHGRMDTPEAQQEAVAVRRVALEALPELAKTPEELFCFVTACRGLRGWGPAFKAAIYAWYVSRSPGALARIIARVWLREHEWQTIDLLRLSHPRMVASNPKDHERFAAINWLLEGERGNASYRKSPNLALLRAVDAAKDGMRDAEELAKRVRKGRLTFEMLPQPVCYAPHAAVAASLENMTAPTILREPNYVNAAVEQQPEAGEGLALALRECYVNPMTFMLAPRTPKTASIYDRAFDESPPKPLLRAVLFAIECTPRMGELASNALTAREVACAWAAMYARRTPQHTVVGFDGFGYFDMTARFREERLEELVKLCLGMASSALADLDQPLRAAKDFGHSRLVILASTCTWSPRHVYPSTLYHVDRLAALALCGARQPQPPDDPRRLDISGIAGDTPELVRAHLDANPGICR